MVFSEDAARRAALNLLSRGARGHRFREVRGPGARQDDPDDWVFAFVVVAANGSRFETPVIVHVSRRTGEALTLRDKMLKR